MYKYILSIEVKYLKKEKRAKSVVGKHSSGLLKVLFLLILLAVKYYALL